VLFVPVFFVVVRRFFKGSERQRKLYAHEFVPGLDESAQPPDSAPPVASDGGSAAR